MSVSGYFRYYRPLASVSVSSVTHRQLVAAIEHLKRTTTGPRRFARDIACLTRLLHEKVADPLWHLSVLDFVWTYDQSDPDAYDRLFR